MAEQTETEDRTCAVCGRRLLLGERSSLYVNREGNEALVCELCKARAEASGWKRPEEVSVPDRATGGRRRRGRGDLLGGLLSRSEREGEQRQGLRRRGSPDPEATSGSQTPGAGSAEARSGSVGPPSRPAHGRSSAGPDIREAIAAFNASDNRRMVGGLSKSLGEARATVIAVRTAAGATGARLTVAWDLAWYQWEIGPGKHGPLIKQTAKGDTADQLRAADRNWNLAVADDGTLARSGEVQG